MIVIATDNIIGTDVKFGEEGVDVVVLDSTGRVQYEYKDSLCLITGFNDNGTINIRIIEDENGDSSNKYLHGVNPADLELCGFLDEDEIDEEDDFMLEEEDL